ncbi:hypothetical protein [Streptomyces sp. NPDC054756]
MGVLVEVDVETREAVEHAVQTATPSAALAATATGELLVAGDDGELTLMSVLDASTQTRGTSRDAAADRAACEDAARAAAREFLKTTAEVPADCDDLETHLLLTDGTRTWEADDLETVTTAGATDPTWLRLQAEINKARLQNE